MRRPTFSEACEHYVHRFTCDHVPAWASNQRADGTFYAPQFRSDKEWYENTKFKGDAGYIGVSNDCDSRNASWPLGKSLNKPFNAANYREACDSVRRDFDVIGKHEGD